MYTACVSLWNPSLFVYISHMHIWTLLTRTHMPIDLPANRVSKTDKFNLIVVWVFVFEIYIQCKKKYCINVAKKKNKRACNEKWKTKLNLAFFFKWASLIGLLHFNIFPLYIFFWSDFVYTHSLIFSNEIRLTNSILYTIYIYKMMI